VKHAVKKKARWAGIAGVTAGAVLVAGPFIASQASAGTTPAAPKGVKAKGAFLMDGSSGKELWGKSADTKRGLASTTKVMTAAVVTSSGVSLNHRVTVKKAYRDYVTKHGASTADLKTGDKLTVRQLMYGMLLPSGCDAAYALADAVGKGSTTAARTKSFISQMNAKAAQLGMKHTKFASFDGNAGTSENYSTPRDMAKLGGYVLHSSLIREVAKSTSTKQKATNGRTYTWYNTNRLLGSYKGVIGIKTGTDTAAGPCLVFAAQRNGRTVVGTILNDATKRYPDATKMLDWAFKQKNPTKVSLRNLPTSAQRD
jgi:D-alanyl-D-alanine carboxypeptidase (penicillin-binding protein 5/6)